MVIMIFKFSFPLKTSSVRGVLSGNSFTGCAADLHNLNANQNKMCRYTSRQFLF